MTLAWLAAISLFVRAGAPASGPVGQHLELGREMFQAGRYGEALDSFFWVLGAAPENVEAKTYIARIGEVWRQAESKAELSPPERAQALADVARLLKQRKRRLAQLDAELGRVRRQLERGLDDPEGLLEASRSLARFKETDLGDRILAEESQRYLELLQKELRKAIQRDGTFQSPKDVFAVRGYLFYYKGNIESAVHEWQRALALAPEDAMLQEQVQWALRKKALLERRQTVSQLLKRAQERAAKKDYEQAVLDWRSLVILDPQSDDFQRSLIQVEDELRKIKVGRKLAQANKSLLKGLVSEASQDFLDALEIDPMNRQALESLKQIQRDLYSQEARGMDKSASARSAQKTEAAARAISSKLSNQQYTLGLIFYSQGDLEKARKALAQAREYDPSNEKAKNALDRIQAELNP